MTDNKPQFEQRNNSGVLFKNAYKTSDRHPDYTGNAKVDDNEYKIAAWTKTSAKGTRFLSVVFTNKDDLHPMGVGKPQAVDNRSTDEILDDEIKY